MTSTTLTTRVLLLVFAAISISSAKLLRQGTVIPEDFVDSAIHLDTMHFDTNKPYSSQNWVKFGYKQRATGDMKLAMKSARRALSIDPSNGLAVGLIIALYVDQRDITHLDKLTNLADRLWPAHYHEVKQTNIKNQMDAALKAQTEQLEKGYAAFESDQTDKIKNRQDLSPTETQAEIDKLVAHTKQEKAKALADLNTQYQTELEKALSSLTKK